MRNDVYHCLALTATLFAAGLHPFSRPVSPDESQITIQPQLLTMREIASRLTTPERKVECAKGIADRVAFVSLKNRPYSDAVQVLGEALDIVLKPKEGAPGAWVLDSDPEVVAQEKRWRRAYADCFQRSLEHEQAAMRPYLGVPFADLRERFLDARSRYEDANSNAGRFGDSSKDPLVQRLYKLFTSLAGASYAPRWLTDRWLRQGIMRPEWLREAIFGSPVIRSDDVRLVTQYLPLTVFERLNDQASAVIYGFDMQLARWSASTIIAFCLPDGRVRQYTGFVILSPHNLRQVFEGTHEDILGAGVGPDAVAWLEGQRKATVQFMATDVAKRVVSIKSKRVMASLSQVVEQWATAADAECVMELTPQREPLTYRNVAAAGLARRLQFSTEAQISLSELFTEVIKSKPIDDMVLPWTVVSKSGVVVLKNRWAFIDRTAPFPLAALRDLERKAFNQVLGDSTEGVSNYEDVLAYCQATTALQNRHWSWLSSSGWYRGLSMYSLTAHAAVALWEGLPAATRKTILSRQGVHRLSMSSVSEQALNRVVDARRSLGFLGIESWHPLYAQELALADLKVTVRQGEDEKRVSLVFAIRGEGMAPIPPVFENFFLKNILISDTNGAQPENNR
jgi:hypothetical protein